MVNVSYANAYKEVLSVINNLIKEDNAKIPKEYIEFLEANCNNEYDFEYNTSKSFDEQELLEDTKYILFGLFEEFGATDTQKAKIKFYKINYKNKLEKQKREEYNQEKIFRNKQDNFNIQTLEKQEEKLELVEHKELKWYQKISKRILKLFRKR